MSVSFDQCERITIEVRVAGHGAEGAIYIAKRTVTSPFTDAAVDGALDELRHVTRRAICADR